MLAGSLCHPVLTPQHIQSSLGVRDKRQHGILSAIAAMGLLQQVVGPAAQHFDKLGTASQVAVVFIGIILLSVILNVLNQIFNKNPNEPPVVFHWLPFIGSTVIYGMDPPTFFKENSEKVRPPPPKSLHNALSCRLPPTKLTNLTVRRCLHLHSPRQEDHRLRWSPRKRVYPERQAEGCQCGRDLQQVDRTRLWKGCGLRLPQCQAHGAEEGAHLLQITCSEIPRAWTDADLWTR